MSLPETKTFYQSKTIPERLYGLCHKDIRSDFPCDSCYGCGDYVTIIEEWLRDLRQSSIDSEFDVFTKILLTLKQEKKR